MQRKLGNPQKIFHAYNYLKNVEFDDAVLLFKLTMD